MLVNTRSSESKYDFDLFRRGLTTNFPFKIAIHGYPGNLLKSKQTHFVFHLYMFYLRYTTSSNVNINNNNYNEKVTTNQTKTKPESQ